MPRDEGTSRAAATRSLVWLPASQVWAQVELGGTGAATAKQTPDASSPGPDMYEHASRGVAGGASSVASQGKRRRPDEEAIILLSSDSEDENGEAGGTDESGMRHKELPHCPICERPGRTPLCCLLSPLLPCHAFPLGTLLSPTQPLLVPFPHKASPTSWTPMKRPSCSRASTCSAALVSTDGSCGTRSSAPSAR